MGTCVSKGQRRPSSRQDHAAPLWSDLPSEVGDLILRRLPSHADRLSFGAVCHQWRFGLRLAKKQQHLPPPLPWICFNVSSSTADCPDRGRLLPRGFTDAGEVGLPTTDMKDCFCSLDGCWVLYEFHGASTARVLVHNASSSAGAAATKVPPRRPLLHGGGTATAVVSTASLKRKMTAPQSRAGPPTWLSSLPPYNRGGHGPWFQDVAFHRGKLYAVTAMDDLFALEVTAAGEIAGESQDEHVIKASSESSPPATTNNLQEERPSQMRYLVVSSCGKKLLMVRWSHRSLPRRLNDDIPGEERTAAAKILERIKMKVFEADFDMGRWLEVDSLEDDQALFVSRGCSRALLLTPGSGDESFQGNRVYFLGVDLPACCKEALCPDYGCEACDDYSALPSYGFFDMRSRTSSPVFLDGKTKDIIVPASDAFSAEWAFPCAST